MQAFVFQPVGHDAIFRFECIKACLRHDLSRYVDQRKLQHKIEGSEQIPYEW